VFKTATLAVAVLLLAVSSFAQEKDLPAQAGYVVRVPVRELGDWEKNEVTVVPNTAFLNNALGKPKKIHFVSRTDITQLTKYGYEAPTVSLLVQATHTAYSRHLGLSLSPEVFWYVISHEVAIYVKANPELNRKLFTDSKDKKKLEVRDDSLVYDSQNNDWARAINLFRGPLRENVPAQTLELFLPKFGTLNEESETALLVSFMDTVSSYYSFGMTTLCGIPQIRLEGAPADWDLLVARTKELQKTFPGLEKYFQGLVPVLETIAGEVNGKPAGNEFWQSIYKVPGGSGGPRVSGWITAFTAYLPAYKGGFEMKEYFGWKRKSQGREGEYLTAMGTNDFATHVSKVDFVWNYYGKEIPMSLAAGILGVEYKDGFVAPRLGYAVVERNQ
jgi:hypothetical protein